MDRKDIAIAGLSLVVVGLFVEYNRLVQDFKSLYDEKVQNEKVVDAAKKIVTEVTFQEIVENFDE